MAPERLALWKRSPRLPVLDSDDPILSRVLLAIREGRSVQFHYCGFTGDTPRTICPGSVFRVEGFNATYLSGYCFTRKQERTFCIERMTLC
jgi:predicted DNA-binding transcriptional regulator YafY